MITLTIRSGKNHPRFPWFPLGAVLLILLGFFNSLQAQLSITVPDSTHTQCMKDSVFLNAVISGANPSDQLTVRFYGTANGSASTPFTIIGLPDTQYYMDQRNGASSAIFKAQTNWVVAQKDILNIAHTCHLGDCVQNGDHGGNNIEWLRADTAMSYLEDPQTTGIADGMSYTMSVGNHDQSPTGDANGTTVFFNQFFGANRFAGRYYWGGHYGNNSDNNFQTFKTGGLDFLVISLEYDLNANANVLSWADSLLKSFPTYQGIIVSHYLLDVPGNFGPQGSATYAALKDNPNLFLMLCGHQHGEGRRSDVYQGREVHTLLSDYQGRSHGGDGWMRIMEIDPVNKTMQVKTYSPWLDQYETDANSEFFLSNLNLPDDTTSFTLLHTATITGNGQTGYYWKPASTDTSFNWYVSITRGPETASSPSYEIGLPDDCGVCNGKNADKDCNGDCFGTASIDGCGHCSGGNTGLPPDDSCTPTCIPNEVTSLSLVQAPSGNLIAPLSDGYVINKAVQSPFSVDAVVCSGSAVNSVVFTLNGVDIQTESLAPYAITGDNPPGSYNPWNPAPGNYTLTATPYSGNGGNGTAGVARTVNISVVESGPAPDCNEDLGGTAFLDGCNICSGGNSGHVANSDQDDCGICFGNNASKDCHGDCSGTASVDTCNVCSGGNTGIPPNSTCTVDCNREVGGTAIYDDCNICSGGNSGHVANSDKDDCSVCFGNNANKDCNGDCFGTASVDTCNVCSGGNTGITPNSTCTVDCNGEVGGTAIYDDCNICSGGNSGHVANSDQDTCGLCFGDNTSCQNTGGSCDHLEVVSFTLVHDGNGGEIALLTDGYIINKSLVNGFSIRADVCDDPVGSVDFRLNGIFFSSENLVPYALNGDNASGYRAWNPAPGTYTIEARPYSGGNGTGSVGISKTVTVTVTNGPPPADCNGDAGGSAFINDCEECVGGNTGKPADFGKDDCDVCFGNNEDKDCAGVCFGTAAFDNCGNCAGGTTGIAPNSGCTVDCNGDEDGTAFLDDCNICSGGNSGHVANSDKDTCGTCFGNNTSCATCVPNEVVSLTLMNTGKAGLIRVLHAQDTIIKSQLPNFSVRADVCSDPDVESVRFFLNSSNIQTESTAPYAIAGDNSGNYHGWNISPGHYSLTATPYSGDKGTGTVGTSETVDLWILDRAPAANIASNGSGVPGEKPANQRNAEDGTGTGNTQNGTATAGSTDLRLTVEGLSMRLFPNPTTGALTVETENAAGDSELMLLDMSGKLLRTVTEAKVSGAHRSYSLDLAALPKGIYLLKLRSGSEIRTKRVVRE